MRQSLSDSERDRLESELSKLIEVTFVKNTEEPDQRYFNFNLTAFDSKGLEIKMNFSDPLLVSTSRDDEVKIKISQEYFMTPDYRQK